MYELPPMCEYCKHQHKGHLTCDAFPNGIPDEIKFGLPINPEDGEILPEGYHGPRFDHRKPYPGDNDIRFEVRDDLDADEINERLDWLFSDDDEDDEDYEKSS